jgi:hypothetical protein
MLTHHKLHIYLMILANSWATHLGVRQTVDLIKSPMIDHTNCIFSSRTIQQWISVTMPLPICEEPLPFSVFTGQFSKTLLTILCPSTLMKTNIPTSTLIHPNTACNLRLSSSFFFFGGGGGGGESRWAKCNYSTKWNDTITTIILLSNILSVFSNGIWNFIASTREWL